MALTYSDQQLSDMSLEYINFPTVIAQIEEQKAQLLVQKVAIKEKDDQNTISTDNYEGIVGKYHDELKYLNGQLRTNYDHANIEEGAHHYGGVNGHFPIDIPGNNIWRNMQPKVLANNQGSPIGSFSPQESDLLAGMIPAHSLVMNGFTDGSSETTLTAPYSGGGSVEVVSTAGFSNGQRIVIDGGGTSLLGTVTGVGSGGYCTPPCTPNTPSQCATDGGVWTTTYSISFTTVTGPSGTLPIGSRVRNYRPAFSEAERTSEPSSYCPEVLLYFKNDLENKVSDLETSIDAELTALNGNDDYKNKTELNAAKANVNSLKATIDSWHASPRTGSSGRFNNTNMAALDNARATRTPQVSSRAAQVSAILGSITQQGDGTFTGSGVYFDLFKWIDLRVNMAGGSLASFYSMEGAEKIFDQQISQTNAKKTEYEAMFVVKQITENPDGSNFVKIENSTGLTVGDTVKIFANDQATLTRIIVSIGATIELNGPVSSDYGMDSVGRLLKTLY